MPEIYDMKQFLDWYSRDLMSFDWMHPFIPGRPNFWERIEELQRLSSIQRMFDPDMVIWNRSVPVNFHRAAPQSIAVPKKESQKKS